MSASEIDTFRWEDGQLLMLDQRALPGAIVYLAYRDAVGLARGITDMVVRGAPAIGCVAAYGIALEASRFADHDRVAFDAALDGAEEVLAASRPTAVNLSWGLAAMRRVRERESAGTSAQIAKSLLDAAHAVTAEDIRANRAMGAFGADLLFDGARVLTHCNAGALAAAGHGTALGVIRSAIEKGLKISVIADETRPYLQGARLTAWELIRDRIPVTLITDNMSGHLMSQGQIDAVIVGCDRVAANGDVANKIGTYMVAVLAQRHGIPFYVACPVATIDRNLAHGGLIPIEERSASEVTGFGGMHWAPQGVCVRNPSFDVTPAALVTALITERGVIMHPDRNSIEALWPD